MLVDKETLFQRLAESELTVVDARSSSEFAAGHIPRAINLPADLLQDPDSARGALLPVEVLAARLGSRGIGNHGPLVLCDDSGLVPSARLFWLLESLGRGEAALLDGGFSAWRNAGLPLESGGSEPRPAEFQPRPTDGVYARRTQVQQAIGRSDISIVDARSAEEYQGRSSTAARDGHIPGAVNIDWQQHILDLFDPTFRPLDQLESLYRKHGVTRDKQVIAYCRSGARSSHTYFVLRLLGYSRVSNYVGSWLEWGNDPALPIE